MEDSPSIYSKLCTSRREIRLLTLYPSQTSQTPIRASLSVVSLSHDPYYETLSYVWGDSDDQRSISLSGQKIDIGKNLWQALRALRPSTRPKILWVDALCINQTDVEERSSQVLLMEAIYRGCTLCCIWLGASNSNIDGAMKVLGDWARGNHLDSGSNFAPIYTSAAGELTSRSWWFRIWTVQESILPGQLEVRCGSNSWGWHVFSKAATNLRHHLTSPCCISHNDTTLEHVLPIGKFINAVLDIDGGRDHSNESRNLSSFNLYRNREATDPRDKIFGLLSLVTPQIRKAVKPDYSMSITEVYTSFCVHLIEATGSLEILSYVLGTTTTGIFKTPSWVPNWAISIPEPSWQQGRLDRYREYNACGGSEFSLELGDIAAYDGTLRARGVYCDLVAGVGEERDSKMKEGIPKDWPQIAKLDRAVGQDAAQDAFWSTILVDTFAHFDKDTGASIFKRGSQEEYSKYKDWLVRIVEGSSWPLATDPLYYLLETATFLRRFFVTGDGKFGMGPAEMQEGDEVHVLVGGNCPLVLRRLDNNNKTDEVQYTLVGDCYLHGFMDGEAMHDFESCSKIINIQ